MPRTILMSARKTIHTHANYLSNGHKIRKHHMKGGDILLKQLLPYPSISKSVNKMVKSKGGAVMKESNPMKKLYHMTGKIQPKPIKLML